MPELNDINQQMSLIANFARAYANATPEQRANVDVKDVQAQLDRYNQLKERRNELYAQQEQEWQKQLEAGRQQQQANTINTRGIGRRVNNTNTTNINLSSPRQSISGNTTFVGTDGVNYNIQPGEQVTDGNGNIMFWDQFSNQLQWIKREPSNQGSVQGIDSPIVEQQNNNSFVGPITGNSYVRRNIVGPTIGGNRIGLFNGRQNIVSLNNRSIIPGRNSYGLTYPGSFMIDNDGNYHELGTGGNITTVYSNGLSSQNPGSFVVNGSGAQVIDRNGNLVKYNNLIPGGYM